MVERNILELARSPGFLFWVLFMKIMRVASRYIFPNLGLGRFVFYTHETGG